MATMTQSNFFIYLSLPHHQHNLSTRLAGFLLLFSLFFGGGIEKEENKFL
jgi:hypothetical protein